MANSPRCQAVIVGIDSYKHDPLDCCVADAMAVHSIISASPYSFSTEILINAGATTAAVKEAIEAAISRDPELFFFYFAGHGEVCDYGFFLTTIDSHERRADDGVAGDFLSRAIDARLGRRRQALLILDCCHSGAATLGSTRPFVAVRGQDFDRYGIQYQSENRALIAACRETQFADEDVLAGHGVFTSRILAGLKGGAARRDGSVSALSLFEFVAETAQTSAARPKLKADSTDGILLARGLKPGKWPEQSQNDQDLARTARDHTTKAQFLFRTGSSNTNWKHEGYRSVAQAITPLVRWFMNRERDVARIRENVGFQEALSDLNDVCKIMSGIETGYAIDDLVVLERIGGGAFGNVWKARAPQGTVALKVFHGSELGIRDKVARFGQGVVAMRQLDHAHVVKVRADYLCPMAFTMDFIDGPNLRSWSGATQDPQSLLDIAITIGEALHHAHEKGVIHRDVKPENVVLQYRDKENTWVPFLTDFDLAWYPTASVHTHEAIGTVQYGAPEQIRHFSSELSHDPKVDVYSFGQILFFMFTLGSDPVPFSPAENRRGFNTRLGNAMPAVGPAERMRELYAQCTSEDPTARPTMKSVLRKLHEARALLHDLPLNRPLSQGQFIKELRFGLCGLTPSDRTEISSRSGHTNVHLVPAGDSSVIVELFVVRTPLVDTEPQFRKAREIVNERIRAILTDKRGVSFSSGSENPYSASIRFDGLAMTMTDQHWVRELIEACIWAAERG